MKNGKDTGKERGAKTVVVNRGMQQKTRSAKMKVVEVKLRGKSKQSKKLASSAKKTVATSPKRVPSKSAAPMPEKTAAKRNINQKTSAEKPASEKHSERSPEKKSAATSQKSAPATAAKPGKSHSEPLKFETPPEYPIIEVPTEKLLRPFRRMAEQNRINAKAMKKAQKAARGSFLAKPIKKGKRFLADLRVHTPGTVGYFANGGIDPGPALVRLATVKGLQMIGLADYYNASYLDQVQTSAATSGLVVLPGVIMCCEVTGCKEVYLLVLFSETSRSTDIYQLLDALDVPKSAYGRRDYCLPHDIGYVLETIERHGAIAIPSRIDKTPYRQLAIQELVERYGLHAFDLAHPDSPELFRDRWPSGGPNGGFTFFSFSSANALGQIGNRVGRVCLSQPTFAGIKEIVSRKSAISPTAVEEELPNIAAVG